MKEELLNSGKWIVSLIEKVKEAVGTLSKERQEEYNTRPDLFNVYSYLKIYSKIQKEIARDLTV